MNTCPKMKEVIEQLAAKHEVDLTQIGAHFRLDMPGYQRLCVESISQRRRSVAHYFEMNGDLVPDPDIVFFVGDQGVWLAIGITDSFGRWRSYAKMTPDGEGIERYDREGQADLADFAEIWAQNLLDQQWLTNGVCTRSSTLDAESQDQISPWPEPTTERPDEETLIAWSLLDGDCEATDGCTVEPDGICSHGHPSWVLKLGMI